jgi:hypothetical protein
LKVEWLELNRHLRREKENEAQGQVSEADVEDAEYFEPQDDAFQAEEGELLMLDAMEQDEEMEIEQALTESQQQPADEPSRPPSVYADEEEYDQLFAELWGQDIPSSQDVNRMDMG